MSQPPKASNLTPDQKPQYQPLLFDWGPAPQAPKTGESSDVYAGSFILVPKDAGDSSSSLNVVENYPWTLTNIEARKYVPKAIITEYYQTLSSELNGYQASLRGVASDLAAGVKQGAAGFQAGVQTAGQLIKGSPQPAPGLAPQVANAIATQKDRETGVSQTAAEETSKNDLVVTNPQVLKSALNPYANLYTVQKSGFVYTFPYLATNGTVDVNNEWGAPGTEIAEGAGGILGGLGKIFDTTAPDGATSSAPAKPSTARRFFNLISGVGEVAGGVARAGGAMTGGLTGPKATEELKAYKGSTAVDAINITFYLYNTIDTGEVTASGKPVNVIKRNWDLCFLLTYQNLPNRISKNLLLPPCLYEVVIPGYKKLPLSTVSNIKITNVGNVRIIDLGNGNIVNSIQNSNCKVVPEAYKVELTFTSVFKNTRNTFLYAAVPEAGITVTVVTTPPA